MQFQLNLQDKYFNLIKNGTKTIELRLYDDKRKGIKIGDTITFMSNISQEQLSAKVIGLHRASSFGDLVDKIDIEKTGFKTLNELNDAIIEFYTIEKQKEFGVLGIEIELMR